MPQRVVLSVERDIACQERAVSANLEGEAHQDAAHQPSGLKRIHSGQHQIQHLVELQRGQGDGGRAKGQIQ